MIGIIRKKKLKIKSSESGHKKETKKETKNNKGKAWMLLRMNTLTTRVRATLHHKGKGLGPSLCFCKGKGKGRFVNFYKKAKGVYGYRLTCVFRGRIHFSGRVEIGDHERNRRQEASEFYVGVNVVCSVLLGWAPWTAQTVEGDTH